MPKATKEAVKECEDEEISFDKFMDLSSALEKQSSIIQEEAMKFLQSRDCPLIKAKCKQMECSWYIMCLNKNMNAFKQFFQ
jgi:hypothetical protein